MKNISFQLTKSHVAEQTKTVTRRLGWEKLKPGTLLQPVEKGMGLKKGEKVVKIGGPIRVLSVRREPLSAITNEDVAREGFPGMPKADFCSFFLDTHPGKDTNPIVTRIEFDYVYLFPVSDLATIIRAFLIRREVMVMFDIGCSLIPDAIFHEVEQCERRDGNILFPTFIEQSIKRVAEWRLASDCLDVLEVMPKERQILEKYSRIN